MHSVLIIWKSYSGAWIWITSGNNDSIGSLTGRYEKVVYEMHQYLDSDGSGTSTSCLSGTIGAERAANAPAWLKANNKKGILGEIRWWRQCYVRERGDRHARFIGCRE